MTHRLQCCGFISVTQLNGYTTNLKLEDIFEPNNLMSCVMKWTKVIVHCPQMIAGVSSVIDWWNVTKAPLYDEL